MTYHDVFTILGTIDAAIADGRRSICVAVPQEWDWYTLEAALRIRHSPPASSQRFSWNFGLNGRMHVIKHGAAACEKRYDYVLVVQHRCEVHKHSLTWVDQALRTRLNIEGRLEFLAI